jgi:glucan phosphoethanolaminetransferase (alkaline phosphatase superfamily)
MTNGKSRLLVLVSAGVILPSAFLFSAVSALPHVLIITFAGLVFSMLISKPVRYSDRSLIYSFVFSLVLAVLLDMVFPMRQDRFFPMAKLFMANITVPVALYLAVFATFYQSNPYTLGFSSALSLIALMLCSNYQSSAGSDSDFAFIG